MPDHFDYIRDDVRHRIRITAHEPLSTDDLIAVIDRQANEDTWAYAVIYDLRAIHEVPARADAAALADYVEQYISVRGPRGPVAVVTRLADIVGAGQKYAFFGEKAGFQVEIFWDLAEAERWLDKQERGS